MVDDNNFDFEDSKNINAKKLRLFYYAYHLQHIIKGDRRLPSVVCVAIPEVLRVFIPFLSFLNFS